MQTRAPYKLEKQFFVELVTHFRKVERETGVPTIRRLRAEVKRFGFVTQKGQLFVLVDPDPIPDAVALALCRGFIDRLRHGISEK